MIQPNPERPRPNLIVLAGFMGTGKTAVGQLLARTLKYSFFDSDREIAARAGKSISQIFSDEGEAFFRKLEKETILRLAETPQLVLSVGGGAILDPEVREALTQKGSVILLTATAEEIARRIGHDEERPLLKAGNRKKKIDKLLMQRESVYAEIPLKIDTTGLPVDEVVRRVMAMTV